MRRPGIGTLLVLALLARTAPALAAALPPSADPVGAFIAVADSVARSGDAALSPFLAENPLLVGAGVASLLDAAFQAAKENPAGAKENVDLAGRIAAAHEAAGGSKVARGLVDTYLRWTSSQRTQRAKAIALETESGEVRKAGDVDKAVTLLTQARAIYEKINDRHSVAVNWGTMGVTHWSTGDWDVVIKDYEAALAARRAVEDHILEGRTLNGLGSAYQQKGDWGRATDYYHQAIDVRQRTGDLTGLGTSLTFLGHVYNNTGRYVEARKQYEAALPILESLGSAKQMIELLTGIAAVNSAMGRVADADAAYRRGIELASSNGLGAYEMLCRSNLADNYRLQGRYGEAIEELGAAFELLKSNPDPQFELLMYQARGLTYMNMGEFDDARDDLLRCAELSKSLDNPARAIDAHINLGFLYRELGAYDRALKAVEDARVMSEQAANGRGYREALAARGEIQLRMGRYDEALASWQEALAQDQADGADAFALADEVSIAGVRAAKGETAAARDALRALAPRARAAKAPAVERAVLTNMGHSFENENPDSAAHYYELALAGLEAEGEKIGGSELQTGYLSGQNRYYFEEIALFYARQTDTGGTQSASWTDRAFRTMERAKARGLLDLMRRSVSARSTPEEDAVLDALYSLDPAASDYAQQRAALEKKYLDLRRVRVDAAVAGLAGGSVSGLDEVASALSKKTVLLEFALGDSASLLWVVERDRREMHMLPPRPQIESEVRRFRDALARVGAGNDEMLASARSLYQLLLEPGAQRLEKAETIVIVPDGALFELPFDALIRGDAQPGAPMSHQWFVARKWATVCAPSATVYTRLRTKSRTQKYERDLFAVGNPDFAALVISGTGPLEPLPFAEKEVEAIAARVKSARRTTLVGRGATEAAVKLELRTESPRVVHLATHGLVDANEPARSSVALSPGDGEDGLFHTLEIISTPTSSDLVVMSACESARGRVSRGEGVVGLSRAFLGAGAESVVASLWSVSDESTAELMGVFYDRMFGKKHSASRALREARVALLDSENFSHPFFWSPFVVTGTERSPW